MEVTGYAHAARWVYNQALEPGAWSDGSILTLTEVRNIHETATLGTAERPIEALAAAHNHFERIHPFLDGNGRTGRLLLNLLLLRLGYAPAIIYLRDRTRYLKGLRYADRGDPGPLGELLARAVLDNLYRFVVPAVAGPNRLVPLTALANRGLSDGALRIAANRGRLRAQKGADGQWRSTQAWVDEYRSMRHKRET